MVVKDLLKPTISLSMVTLFLCIMDNLFSTDGDCGEGGW